MSKAAEIATPAIETTVAVAVATTAVTGASTTAVTAAITTMSKIFKPPLYKLRKKLANIFGLHSKGSVRFGKISALRKPLRTYKTKGDGNCYFRAISYILIGSEDDHLIIRKKVIEHMKKYLTKSNSINRLQP